MMDIMFLLIPLSVVIVFVIGVIFWWSLRQGQFEDLEGPAFRILMDDDSPAGSRDSSGSAQRSDEDRGIATRKNHSRTTVDPDQ